MAKLATRVLGCYWPYWNGPVLSTLPKEFNTIYLFSGRPIGGTPGTTGAIFWDQNRQSDSSFKTDIANIRNSGRCVILSIGGAGEYIRIDTQTRAQAFVDSVKKIYTDLGGFDGLDLNLESTEVWPDLIVWIAKNLKATYGADFAITYPPAPWRAMDKTVATALKNAGMLDLVSPQYYDLSGLSTETEKINHMVTNVTNVWVPIAGDPHKVGIGYGVASAVSETMTVASFITAWKTLVAKYPTLRGAFEWEVAADAKTGYTWVKAANTALQPTLSDSTTPPTPVQPTPEPVPTPTPTPPSVTTDGTVKAGSGSYKLSGTNITRLADSLVRYTRAKYSATPTNRWGAEVVVQDGKVTKVVDRGKGTDPGPTPIPTNGVVLSGHGKARTFLLNNAKVGTSISMPA